MFLSHWFFLFPTIIPILYWVWFDDFFVGQMTPSLAKVSWLLSSSWVHGKWVDIIYHKNSFQACVEFFYSQSSNLCHECMLFKFNLKIRGAFKGIKFLRSEKFKFYFNIFDETYKCISLYLIFQIYFHSFLSTYHLVFLSQINYYYSFLCTLVELFHAYKRKVSTPSLPPTHTHTQHLVQMEYIELAVLNFPLTFFFFFFLLNTT